MKLIIAEKPSMARSIKNAIESELGENFDNKKEYWESENYYVTSAFGHLFELQQPHEYDENLKKWSLDTLPFFPAKYEYSVKKDCNDRVNTISMLSKKCEEIIHAGDSDREGQIIVDIILTKIGYRGLTTRLWLKDLEAKTICQSLKERKNNNEYKNLSLEGRFRQVADWVYGINLTRYATIKAGGNSLLVVGRVIDAIVAIVCERDREIKNFVSTPFWQLEFPLSEDLVIASKQKHENKTDADKQLDEYLKGKTIVKEVSTKEVSKRPPKLFSQTKLQNECSRQFGWSADETLEVSQKLYEAGLTTYPRTDSEYLSAAEKDRVKEIIAAHKHPHMKFKDTKAVFDSSKVAAHSAIIPTSKIHKFVDPESREAKCYKVIFDRFLANFYDEEFLVNKTEITINVLNDSGSLLEEIKTSGEIMKQPGWSSVLGGKKDKALPDLKKGDILPGKWVITEKKTTPPQHFTVETLNNMLENPFKKESETEDETYRKLHEGQSIGTEATRAVIIAKSIDNGFIKMDKKTYRITDKGEYLVDILKELQIDMTKEKTVELSVATTKVGAGTQNISEALDIVYSDIRDIISKNITPARSYTEEGIGVCPACSSPIRKIKSKKSGDVFYICSNKECGKFIIAEKFLGKKLSASQIGLLLKGKTTGEIKGFKKKDGGTFNAKLILKQRDDGSYSIGLAPFEKNEPQAINAKCPACGEAVKKIVTKDKKGFYVCGNDECKKLLIPETISKKKLQVAVVEELINNKETKLLKGFTSKNNKKFNAKLALETDSNGKYVARFSFND